MEEYCMKAKPLRAAQDSIEMDDFYDDDCYDMDDDDDEEDEDLSDNEEKEAKYDDAEDSGNGESWNFIIFHLPPYLEKFSPFFQPNLQKTNFATLPLIS